MKLVDIQLKFLTFIFKIYFIGNDKNPYTFLGIFYKNIENILMVFSRNCMLLLYPDNKFIRNAQEFQGTFSRKAF